MRECKVVYIGLVALFALLLYASIQGETLSGAKGYSHRFYNRSYSAWLIVNLGKDSPNMNCHVSYLNDGSWWGGWGGAQVDTSTSGYGGSWKELAVCDYVDGYKRIRVNTRSRITLTDPPENPNLLPAQEDTCDCSSTIEPGTQVWTTGPEDPTIDWPPPYINWEGGWIFPDTTFPLPLPHWEYVVDYEESTGVVRVTNYPLAEGIVFVIIPMFPDTLLYPVLPGESRRFLPDGSPGYPGNVLVYPPQDTFVHRDETVELSFELWNLSPDPVTFANEAEDTDGWPLKVSAPVVTVPPASYVRIIVTATCINPGLQFNMVTLQATDISDTLQTHWGACFVEVALEPTDAEEQVPANAWLGQCRPNPFNPTTEIPFKLSAPTLIRIAVYDVSGRHIATLAEGTYSTGWHTVTWDARNSSGTPVESGVYFYCLELENGKKMVLMK